MTDLTIGEVAREAGVAPSALRYYEKAGLIPAPPRSSRRRHYDRQVLGRIRIILLARDAGFSVSETRTFLNGFPLSATPAARWRAMAQQKIAELDALATRLADMKSILEASFHCECRRLEDCERFIAAKKPCRSNCDPARVSASKAPLQRLRAKTPGRKLLGVLILLGGSFFAAAAVESPAVAAPAVMAPPARKIDLNEFDASKKLISLPNGESLAYIDSGRSLGSAVVLIHGYTDNARDWVPLLPYLSKPHRLILVDIRGHGRSSKPECCYTRLDFAYDIKLLLDALGVGKADLVGHSLGSIIAQTFAEYWPERTGRVVLISSTGGWPPDRPKKAVQFDFAAEIRKLKEPIEADSPFMIAWWDSPTPVDPDFILRQRKDAAGIPLRVWLAVLDQALPANAYADLQGTLPRLKAPALLIWGSKDPIMEPEVRQSLRDALPNAKVKIFDGLGHNPFWEDPQGVADVINAFLSAAT